MRDVTDYILEFYLSLRLHSKLGYQSPNAFERNLTGKALIEVSGNTWPLQIRRAKVGESVIRAAGCGRRMGALAFPPLTTKLTPEERQQIFCRNQ